VWICCKIGSAGSGRVQLDQQRVGHAVAGSMERGDLVEAAMHDAAALIVSWFGLVPLGEELEDLIEVPSGQSAYEWNLVRQFVEHLHGMLDAGAAEVIEISLDEAEPLGDAGGH
jgi:hypothetical protein